MKRLILLLALLASPLEAAVYYISPSGSDGAAGTSTGTAWKTFNKAFDTMAAGDTLWLMDGTYSVAAGTGVIDPNGTNSEQPPSGTGPSGNTIVQAINPGEVTVVGYAADGYSGTPLRLGRGTGLKRSYITIDGITFDNDEAGWVGGTAGWLYNTSYVTIKNCGFIGSFSVGTNDHEDNNTRALIQDVWIVANQNRIIASNYRADENVWRRVVIRGDGCGIAGSPGPCEGSGNPNVGITIYDSKDVSFQNVVVVDRILDTGADPDAGYSDFSTAQHTPGAHQMARNEWLGCLSLKAPDGGFILEGDEALVGPVTWTIRDSVAWDTSGACFNHVDFDGVLSNLTAHNNCAAGSCDGVRVAPDDGATGSVTNIEVARAGRYGINSKLTPTYCNVFGAQTAAYNQTTCVTGATTVDALSDTPRSLEHILRIEADSATLKGTGSGGADKGANIIYRYGTDGTRHGDSGYNTLTGTLLWPWPNQARIKQEMCTDLSITRGFCSGALTLTGYIWNYLGNGSPYEGAGVTVETTSLPNGTVGQSYAGTACLSATGGLGAPYTWSVTAGSLPTSVTLGSDGCWSGTPSVANTFNFTVQACDATPTCDPQTESIIINPAPSVDVVAMPGHNYIVAVFGKAGLPYSDSCDAVVKIGEATQATFTSTSGPSRRTLALTGLTASTAYNIDVTCTSASANRVTSTTLATPSGGNRTVSISVGAPTSVLPTAARVTVDYGATTAVSDGSIQNTNCGSGCTVNLALPAGLRYRRLRWQTAADVVLATSAVEPLLVQ